MSFSKTLLACAAAAVALSGAANAALVTVRDNPDNGPSVFANGLGRGITINHNGTNRSVSAGVFSLQYSANNGWTDFLSFCLQLSEYLTLPKLHAEVDGAVYFPDQHDRRALGIVYGNFLTPQTGLRNATSAAALQSIIWEIVEDGADNFNLSTGAFKLLSNDVLTEANSLWTLAMTGQFKPVNINVFAARGTQDLIVSEVPIPAGVYLFGSAIAGFAFSKRNRKGSAAST
jgi:opacity protein-like surface antigen